MRTRLFLAFLSVILLALVSNLIYERLIIRDFADYSGGVEEDRVYLVLASVEGSFTQEGWDAHQLSHALRWGTMLGYDIVLLDADGVQQGSSLMALKDVTPSLRLRIESLVHIDTPVGEFEEYPLFFEGEEIGFLLIRPLEARSELGMKERMFRQRGGEFLTISFLIAGGSAFVLAILMSLLLTRPLRRLKDAAGRVAGGDLSVRVEQPGSLPRKDEIGKLIASFNRMVESLEREETLRRHLTSNIAHELRTPLTVLRSSLEAVSDGVVPCEAANIRELEGEVERLTSLVKGIEDFTRAEAALLSPPEYEEIDLGEFTAQVAHSMERVLSSAGLALTITCEAGRQVSTDPGKLETVLRNILANTASHAGGSRLDLSCGILDTTDKTGEGFYIEVADSGPGIEEGEMDNIFKRFYKRVGSEGTGLGLAIASELVISMGGTLTATNRHHPQSGASFRIEMPERDTR